MKKVLIVDATGRNAKQSRTKYLSEEVIKNTDLSKQEVIVLDLYQTKLPYVSQEILESRYTKEYVTEEQIIANDIVDQFEASDLVVFVYPIWNWSIPAVLKTYIDLIMISNRNFTYNGAKIVGLLENKKALLISTGGGPLFGSLMCKIFNMDNPNLYMQKLMGVLGIKDNKTISIGAMSYKFKNKEKDLKFDKSLFETHVRNIITKRTAEINNFCND